MAETPTPTPIDLAEIRRRLADRTGRDYWRSLNEIAQTDEFVEFLEYEFPRQAEGIRTAVDRRDFLKLMSASLGLAGLTACTQQPDEKIVAYVKQPEHLVLGQATYYATAFPLDGYGLGLLAESHEYRPTKVEGNPDHPSSLGATDVFAQASVLGLYDPDRAKTIINAGQIRTWQAFLDAAGPVRFAQAQKQGAGLRILTGTVTSPTLVKQIQDVLAAMPQARWHQWEAAPRDGVRLGARQAFGTDVQPVYHFDRAAVVLSLDADVVNGPGGVRYAKDLAAARKIVADKDPCRLYVAESFTSPTGTIADHRLPVRASDVEALARAIAQAAGVPCRQVPGAAVVANDAKWIQAVAKDLRANAGRAVVVAGDQQPAAVHAVAAALNVALGAVGKTVDYVAPVEGQPTAQLESLQELVADMAAGKVDVLLMLGTNPTLTAPVDLEFGKALEKVGLRIHLGLYHDETSEFCHWQLAEAHYLESWGDVRGHDGTATLIQPLIQPLYGGKTASEVVAAFQEGKAGKTAYDLVQDYWKTQHAGADFGTWWDKALHDGTVPDTAAAVQPVTLQAAWDQGALPQALAADDVELVFRLDPTLHDGRFANNGWLQELPKPLTKITWDNVIFVAPAMAEQLGLTDGDVAQLEFSGRSVHGPGWVQPGMPAGSVTVHVGHGRWRGGEVCTGVGFDAYALRTAAAVPVARGAVVTKTRLRSDVACTQDHQTMGDPHVQPGVTRPVVRQATLAEYRHHPEFAQHMEHQPGEDETLVPAWEYKGHAWGMTIDLGACTGCTACQIACVAENNIPVVGKEMILRGREMHWIRIDRYFAGSLDAPDIVNQPVPCMQCENAPCEVVCPVNATVHSSEGLNDMVYNRCVGTRYCSNNCPYKVRRFNYFLYQNWTSETLKMGRNPDVTVRSRGVMEKCTYCVQRIEEVRHLAKRENRPVRDGEIRTACQQACPTDAIVFGDINDPQSRVAALKKDPRNYALLAELNTRPRTTYLAAVTNPNPELTVEKSS